MYKLPGYQHSTAVPPTQPQGAPGAQPYYSMPGMMPGALPAQPPQLMPPSPPFAELPPHFPVLIGPKEKESLFLDPEIRKEAKNLIMRQLAEEAKQAALRTALLEQQVKQAGLMSAQMNADLEVSKSGLPQKLLQLQIEAAAVQTQKAEDFSNYQTRIAEVTVKNIDEEELRKEKTEKEFEKATRHKMFS